MLVQMEGHYGCKALERNTSLELSKFCKRAECELCEHPKNTLECVLEGNISYVLCLDFLETKSVYCTLKSINEKKEDFGFILNVTILLIYILLYVTCFKTKTVFHFGFVVHKV